MGDAWNFWMIPNWPKIVKGVTHAHLVPIWYDSEPSDIPYSPNQFLGWDFFAVSYSKMTLNQKIFA